METKLHPHRRRNPLTGEWILCSPHRATRPWLGQTEAVAGDDLPKGRPHLTKQLAAGHVPVSVVDLFEAVEIDEYDGAFGAVR